MPFRLPKRRVPRATTVRPVDTAENAATNALIRGVGAIGEQVQRAAQKTGEGVARSDERRRREREAFDADRERQQASAAAQGARLREQSDRTALANRMLDLRENAAEFEGAVEDLDIDPLIDAGATQEKILDENLRLFDEKINEARGAVPKSKLQEFDLRARQERLGFRDKLSPILDQKFEQKVENDRLRFGARIAQNAESVADVEGGIESYREAYPDREGDIAPIATSLLDTLARNPEEVEGLLESLPALKERYGLSTAAAQGIEERAKNTLHRFLDKSFDEKRIHDIAAFTPEELEMLGHDESGRKSLEATKHRSLDEVEGIVDQLREFKGEAWANDKVRKIEGTRAILEKQSRDLRYSGDVLGDPGDQLEASGFIPDDLNGSLETYIRTDPRRNEILSQGNVADVADLIVEDTSKLRRMPLRYQEVINQWWGSGNPALQDRAKSIATSLSDRFNNVWDFEVQSSGAPGGRSRRAAQAFGGIDKATLAEMRSEQETPDALGKKAVESSQRSRAAEELKELDKSEIVAQWGFDPTPTPSFERWVDHRWLELRELSPNSTSEEIMKDLKTEYSKSWSELNGKLQFKPPHVSIGGVEKDVLYGAVKVHVEKITGKPIDHTKLEYDPLPGDRWMLRAPRTPGGVKVPISDPSSPDGYLVISKEELTGKGSDIYKVKRVDDLESQSKALRSRAEKNGEGSPGYQELIRQARKAEAEALILKSEVDNDHSPWGWWTGKSPSGVKADSFKAGSRGSLGNYLEALRLGVKPLSPGEEDSFTADGSAQRFEDSLMEGFDG